MSFGIRSQPSWTMAARHNTQTDNRDGLLTQSKRMDRLEEQFGRLAQRQEEEQQTHAQIQQLVLELRNTHLNPVRHAAQLSHVPPVARNNRNIVPAPAPLHQGPSY